jgi:L-2-hydroxyglutarate oxidase LhgO
MADAAVTVIGGGVVGLAIAAELSRDHAPLYVLERHHTHGQETSSRNSEVIHAGIYYPHGSLKAKLCVEGKNLLYDFCTQHSIAHRRIGKIITTTDPSEVPALEALHHHGRENGVELQLLTAADVKKLEPNIVSFGGMLSPSTGILSAHELMNALRLIAQENGALFQGRSEVVALEKQSGGFLVSAREPGGVTRFSSEIVVNAAGLECDTVAALAGIDVDAAGYRLHWAKGSYFAVRGERKSLVSRLIYPMPPRESLGVHAVIDLAGGLRFGPDVDYLQERVMDYSLDEARRPVFGEAVRKILPAIRDEDLSPDFSGIRPKLQAPGEPQKDFIICHETARNLPGLVNLIGIDSPGLTASLAIAREVRRIIAA